MGVGIAIDHGSYAAERLLEGLNEAQLEAAAAVRGPVCILAGAGTGKTTTITRRIAYQVATGTFGADEVLAVTFTEKAAREMAARLCNLGVAAARARTFHAEALAQFRRFSGTTPEIVASKAQTLHAIAQRLPPPYRYMALRDLATEIEWAKNRRLGPADYLHGLHEHLPPIPADLMHRVYADYERIKDRAGRIDFEDLLECTIGLLGEDERALSRVRSRYRGFTVDEYQDVNLLQQTLLDMWVGPRRDVCVVGDDYQSIFGFTGATPRYLLSFAERPDCRVLRLEENYRSTPEILTVANRLARSLRGSAKTLRATRPSGPNPTVRQFATGADEVTWITNEIRRLHREGVAYEQIAILYRINGRSEDVEETLSRERIPFQVRDGSFIRRPAARTVMARLRHELEGGVPEAVRRVVISCGFDPDAEPSSDDEATRQADLARLLRLAEEFGGTGLAAFVADLRSRFQEDDHGRGVLLLTYHRAKGLEFDAVFLPRLEDKELPFALARGTEELSEDRRLFYVGITRARRHLFLTWASSRPGERRSKRRVSPFLDDVMPGGEAARTDSAQMKALNLRPAGAGGLPSTVLDESDPVVRALREWRLRVSREVDVPAYIVFDNKTLGLIAAARPSTRAALLAVPGVGPKKLERYAEDVLQIVRGAELSRAGSRSSPQA